MEETNHTWGDVLKTILYLMITSKNITARLSLLWIYAWPVSTYDLMDELANHGLKMYHLPRRLCYSNNVEFERNAVKPNHYAMEKKEKINKN